MNLIDEDQRALTARAGDARLGDALADLLDAARDRGIRDEAIAGVQREQAREGRLADTGRAPEDQRRNSFLLDRETDRAAGSEHVRLADDFVERTRPHAIRERRILSRRLGP